jgi:hypothetical protein
MADELEDNRSMALGCALWGAILLAIAAGVEI